MKKLIWYISDFFTTMKKHHVEMYAAASAFFIFICIIPFLTILMYFIPYTPLDKNILNELVKALFPDIAYSLSFSLIDEIYNRTNAILPLSIITMLWTASKTMVSVRNGLNDINGIEEKKNFLIVRLIASLYTFLAIIMIVLISFISLFGERIHELLSIHNIRILNYILVIIDYRVLITIIGFFLTFLFFYAFLPAKNIAIKKVIPGALFSSLACQLFSRIFIFLINNYLSFSMYGSLATIVVIMMYFNFFFYFFFLGAYLNRYLVRRKNNAL